MLWDGIKQATHTERSRKAERSFLDDVSFSCGQQVAVTDWDQTGMKLPHGRIRIVPVQPLPCLSASKVLRDPLLGRMNDLIVPAGLLSQLVSSDSGDVLPSGNMIDAPALLRLLGFLRCGQAPFHLCPAESVCMADCS